MKPVKAEVERVGGIEPPSPAWKAGVIAFIRYPQAIESINQFKKNWSVCNDRICLLQVFYRIPLSSEGAQYNVP